WAYYHVHGRVITTPSESVTLIDMGSNTFDASGSGAHDRVRVGERVADVASWSMGILTTGPLHFPAGTVSANGSQATAYTTLYPLPADFRNLDEPSSEFHWWSGIYVTPDQAMKLERVSNTSGPPYHWTIVKDPDSDGWALKIFGYPTSEETIDFVYRRSPRPLRYSGHEASARVGTISRAASANVIGSGTQFSSDMVGSILRVGDTTNLPGPITSIIPYKSETRISRVVSGTTVVTDASSTIASSTKYLITDPIDVAPHMHNVIYSAAEYWLARIRNQKPDNAFAMYQRDLRLAMEMDQLAPLSGRSPEVWNDHGWRSPLKPDGGA
ncbi:MAG: hypothetical protein EBR82_82795, partial [Caulobacteraceae bacterium]|nr:hypothetical protein [Caulobacteraceae bacterium]